MGVEVSSGCSSCCCLVGVEYVSGGEGLLVVLPMVLVLLGVHLAADWWVLRCPLGALLAAVW